MLCARAIPGLCGQSKYIYIYYYYYYYIIIILYGLYRKPRIQGLRRTITELRKSMHALRVTYIYMDGNTCSQGDSLKHLKVTCPMLHFSLLYFYCDLILMQVCHAGSIIRSPYQPGGCLILVDRRSAGGSTSQRASKSWTSTCSGGCTSGACTS